MRKEIKQYGHTVCISLTRQEQKVYGIKVGDIVDLTITQVIPINDCFASSQPSHKSKKQHTQKRKEKKQ